jgi:hypothetical protein
VLDITDDTAVIADDVAAPPCSLSAPDTAGRRAAAPGGRCGPVVGRALSRAGAVGGGGGVVVVRGVLRRHPRSSRSYFLVKFESPIKSKPRILIFRRLT